jgi:hypothetical protein
MRDLHSLFEKKSGAITDTEFQEQKLPILEQLKKFLNSIPISVSELAITYADCMHEY